jgi:hypothetical protein
VQTKPRRAYRETASGKADGYFLHGCASAIFTIMGAGRLDLRAGGNHRRRAGRSDEGAVVVGLWKVSGKWPSAFSSWRELTPIFDVASQRGEKGVDPVDEDTAAGQQVRIRSEVGTGAPPFSSVLQVGGAAPAASQSSPSAQLTLILTELERLGATRPHGSPAP